MVGVKSTLSNNESYIELNIFGYCNGLRRRMDDYGQTVAVCASSVPEIKSQEKRRKKQAFDTA